MIDNLVEVLPTSRPDPVWEVKDVNLTPIDPNLRDPYRERMAVADYEPSLPVKRHPLLPTQILFGADNPDMIDPATGQAASRSVIPYVENGGGPFVEAQHFALAGMECVAIPTPSFLLDLQINDGGSGYGVNTRVVFSGGGNHPKKRLPACTVQRNGSGTIVGVPLTDFGEYLTEPPIATVVDPDKVSGTDAALTARMYLGFKSATVTARGAGYTWATATITYTAIGNTRITVQAMPLIVDGEIDKVVFVEAAYNIDTTQPITCAIAGNPGSGGAAFTVETGVGVLRCWTIRRLAPQSAPATGNVAGAYGAAPATVGFRVGAAPTINAKSVTTATPAQANDPFANHGLLLPEPFDDGHGTLFVVFSAATDGNRQVVAGNQMFSNAAQKGGWLIRYNGGGVYQNSDVGLRTNFVTQPIPVGTIAGDIMIMAFSWGGISGETYVSGAATPQGYRDYARIGEAAAIEAAAGGRGLLQPWRPVGVGNTSYFSSAYTRPITIHGVFMNPERLTPAEIDQCRPFIVDLMEERLGVPLKLS